MLEEFVNSTKKTAYSVVRQFFPSRKTQKPKMFFLSDADSFQEDNVLLNIPNEILLMILRHVTLDTQRAFAYTSHSSYTLAMDTTLCFCLYVQVMKLPEFTLNEKPLHFKELSVTLDILTEAVKRFRAAKSEEEKQKASINIDDFLAQENTQTVLNIILAQEKPSENLSHWKEKLRELLKFPLEQRIAELSEATQPHIAQTRLNDALITAPIGKIKEYQSQIRQDIENERKTLAFYTTLRDAFFPESENLRKSPVLG